MNESQYIEVAEKVWGWKQSEAKDMQWEFPEEVQLHSMHPTAMLIDMTSETHWTIEKEVNSWQGFGRTVEAMKEKHDFPMEVWYSERYGEKKLGFLGKEFYPIHWNGFRPQELIEATHLAALEALK